MQKTDVIIVGAGPIGLELAVALKHLGTDYVHLEAQQIGHTVTWYPKQTRFFSSPERIAIAGMPLETADQEKATREQYLAYLRAVVGHFDLQIRTFEPVAAIERSGESFLLTTPRGRYEARRVVLAIGDMHRPRRLDIPGEDMPHVSHYFDEPHRYFRRDLVIVGGRNSAAEAAIRCSRVGARVAISHRRDRFDDKSIKYWLLPELHALIKSGRIAYHPLTIPVAIEPDGVILESVRDREQQPAKEPSIRSPTSKVQGPKSVDVGPWTLDVGHAAQWRRIPADDVLLLTGYEMDTTLLEQAGVDLVGDNRAPRLDLETMQTNVPGLYIAGTAAAGTQNRFRLFIENCHPHVARIAGAVTGRKLPADLINDAAEQYELPES